jgi:hypothetical protein
LTSEYFNKGKSKCNLFFYWPILKESWNPPFIWPIGDGFTTYFRCDYRRDWPLNEENKPRLLAVSTIQCIYLITPLDVIGAEWVKIEITNIIYTIRTLSDYPLFKFKNSSCMIHIFYEINLFWLLVTYLAKLEF